MSSVHRTTYTSEHVDLTIDVVTPKENTQRCAVLIFHGGGWRRGTPEMVHDRAAALASHGFIALAVQYRLLDVAAWPAPLVDAAAALNWTRTHAVDLDIDPRRVVAQGHSAVGHIALMTGTLETNLRPAAIVAYYPVIGFHDSPASGGGTPPGGIPQVDLDATGRVASWMMFPPNTSENALAGASPYDILRSDSPPTVVFHGGDDSMIDVRSSISLYRRLRELRVPSDLHVFSGVDHEFDRAPSMVSAATVAAALFIERLITRRHEAENEARRYAFPPRT